MRIHWLAAVAALAMLGGCDSANQSAPAAQKAAAPAIAPGTTITASVVLHDQMTIGAGAKLDARLIDSALPDAPLAEKTIDVSGNPPFNFTLDFDPARVNAGRSYEVKATLVDGDRRFQAGLATPVLTHGAGTSVQIMLTAEATPAEALKEEFGKLQGRIGGMKKVAGTYTTDTSSVAWDAFVETNVVRYVRVNTVMDEDKGGARSAVFYAFTKDGKPMFVQQKGGAMVGWGDDGKLLVNEKHGGGEVAQGEVESMRDAAAKAGQMAQEKYDAGKKK